MADPITTVVTVISEHPQAAATVASIYGVAKPFLAKILGPGAEELGEIGRDYIKGRRAKNTERTLAEADNLLAATGREPQEVPLDIAVPLLEGASLQEDPTLADKWAALLANAADPAQKVRVQPGFTEVLRQLTPTDARILQMLYHHSGHAIEPVGNRLMRKEVMKSLDLTYDEATLYSENLLRLGLCANAAASVADISNSIHDGVGIVATTAFGLTFMRAVTPPTS